MFRKIRTLIRLKANRIIWKKKNTHNETFVNSIFPLEKVSVGKGTYGPLNFVWLTKEDASVKIGNYCSIAEKTTFLVGGEHDYHRLSTYPFQTKTYNQSAVNKAKHDIVVEDDVWIGYDSLILQGVTIGKGSVIGARSVVAKDIPPYSVYAGNKIIKQRFSDDQISKIKNIDYSKVSHCKNDLYADYCQEDITDENLEEILSAFQTGICD